MAYLSGYVRGLMRFSQRLNHWIERFCALLLAVMVLIVWFGVLQRYVLELGVTWTEELARYVMIWAALLAVSCGAHHREHIGFELLFSSLPQGLRNPLRVILDLVAITFFLFLAVLGVGMASDGLNQYAMIFGMTMLVPFASVPTAAALTAFHIIVLLLRDLMALDDVPPGQAEEVEGAA